MGIYRPRDSCPLEAGLRPTPCMGSAQGASCPALTGPGPSTCQTHPLVRLFIDTLLHGRYPTTNVPGHLQPSTPVWACQGWVAYWIQRYPTMPPFLRMSALLLPKRSRVAALNDELCYTTRSGVARWLVVRAQGSHTRFCSHFVVRADRLTPTLRSGVSAKCVCLFFSGPSSRGRSLLFGATALGSILSLIV